MPPTTYVEDIMGDALIQYVFSAGFRLIDQCEEARQCEVEVVRIAVRTQNVLATLRDAQEQSREVTCLEVGLLELKSVFEDVHGLVNRCSNTLTLRGKASMMVQRGPNPNKAALIKAEKRLERVTQVSIITRSPSRSKYECCRLFCK